LLNRNILPRKLASGVMILGAVHPTDFFWIHVSKCRTARSTLMDLPFLLPLSVCNDEGNLFYIEKSN
jgi:hypothetical protein